MSQPPTAISHSVLVLDIGSSSVRATFFNSLGRSLPPTPAMRKRYAWTVLPEGAMECDPEPLLQHVLQVVDAALEHAREEGLGIAGVAVATFWHSLMGLNVEGAPSTPLYGWGDMRATAEALRLRERVDEQELHRRTGCFLHPSYPSVRLVWLRSTYPDAFARTNAWVSFPEYLEERLFGVRRCSLSMASGSGLLDVRRGEWDEGAVGLAGISLEQLSTLVDADDAATGLRPEYAERWPELSEVPWFPPLGDGACANAGSGAVGPDRPGLTIGTSAAVRALWEPAGEVSIPDDLWCYRLDRRWWVVGGALSNGGNTVAYLRRTLLLGASAEVEAQVAALPADGHGLTVLPFLRSERGPGWREEREAVIAGMSDATRPEEVLRAWMEATAYRLARVEDRVEETVGPAREVVASGGALHSSGVWSQILADTLDRPVLLAAEREDTSRGAALRALESLGMVPGLLELDPPVGRRFEPDAEAHQHHRAALDRQQRLLESYASWAATEEQHRL